jgi:hypothetical protein
MSIRHEVLPFMAVVAGASASVAQGTIARIECDGHLFYLRRFTKDCEAAS